MIHSNMQMTFWQVDLGVNLEVDLEVGQNRFDSMQGIIDTTIDWSADDV